MKWKSLFKDALFHYKLWNFFFIILVYNISIYYIVYELILRIYDVNFFNDILQHVIFIHVHIV